MANNKWIKWVVGLSSTALFAGFIGINANQHTQSAETARSGQISDSDRVEANHSDDWFQTGDDESFPWDLSEPGNSGDFGDSGGASHAPPFGRMRSHAS
ncbi:hypothetical protein [Paenibacillus thermotolerans]|uniref:hypothetical protein n=1 Tax=Paenibacillus thermotolerans TaxID=3027807 RepID=UPI00236774DC|nr:MULTISPECIES: hypothetical protein [unclassified Paenibacillus]